MKCLLVIPRWSELESLLPASGRPHLDLLLNSQGFSAVSILELEMDLPFDPNEVPNEYQLILVQGEPGSRLRRSLLSNLGLSLWLDDSESGDQLRVVGARQIYGPDRKVAGFAVYRRNRVVVFVDQPIWALREELVKAIQGCMQEDKLMMRGRPSLCWMIDGSVDMGIFPRFLREGEYAQCEFRHLPDGDMALFMPGAMQGSESLKELQEQLGNHLYAQEPCRLEELISARLMQSNWQVALAESCTAGMVTARLSAVPGSSAYLTAAFVTYSNPSKQQFLYVPDTLIQRCGAVSPEVALAMARGAMRAANSDVAVAITGIAGPNGGTPEKPVGTVFLAAVARTGKTIEYDAHFQGNRDRIRFKSSQVALHLIRRLTPIAES